MSAKKKNIDTNRRIVVLGASPKQDRYSNKALRELKSLGFTVYPVNPGHRMIEGIPVFRKLAEVPRPVDTVTVYVNPEQLINMLDDLIAINPKRVILNPGTFSEEIFEKLQDSGIETLDACTLVMLATNQLKIY